MAEDLKRPLEKAWNKSLQLSRGQLYINTALQ